MTELITAETTTQAELLVDTVKEIAQYRKDTSNNQEYLQYMDNILNYSPEIFTSFRKIGPVMEALFLISCQDLNIPIDIATGDQDCNDGIDFFLNNIPIDTTCNTNPMHLNTIYSELSIATPILIPTFSPQYGSCLNLFLNNKFSTKVFLQNVYSLNMKVYNCINSAISNSKIPILQIEGDAIEIKHCGVPIETKLRSSLQSLSRFI